MESGEQLEIYFPDGQKFTNLKEVSKQLAEERQKTLQAEERANRLAARLRELGIEEDIGIS